MTKRTGNQLVFAAVTVAALAGPVRGGMATVRIGRAPAKRPSAPARKVRAKPPTGYVVRADKAPTIDGKVAEPVWDKARTLRLARTLQGGESVPQPTAVKVLRDARRLYVAFISTEPLTNRWSLSFIFLAALLVKVTAIIRRGLTPQTLTR